MAVLKLILKGAHGVGKTSIAAQFAKKRFDISSSETDLQPDYTRTLTLDGESYTLEVLDVPDDFHMGDYFTECGHGFVIVYSVCDPKTFECAKSIRGEIVQIKDSERVPIVLVANKRDLASTDRVVEECYGAELASRWPNCRFTEITAKDYGEVEEAFQLLVREVIAVERDKQLRSRNKAKCVLL